MASAKDRKGKARRTKAVALPAQRAGEGRSDTKRRLIDAALGLFAERGFEGATTAQIAARAGVAEKTLFANFGSKERVYQAALEPATLLAFVMPEALRTLEPVFASPPSDLRALVGAIVKNRIAFARAHSREVKLLVQHLLQRPEAIASLLVAFEERIAPHLLPILRELEAAGALRKDVPPLTVVRLVVTALFGYVVTRVVLRPDAEWDDDLEARYLVTALVDGLAPRGESAGGS